MSDMKQVENIKDMPKLYVMFPDDEAYARRRIREIKVRLFSRGRIVPEPLRVFRYTYPSEWSMIGIEIEEKEVQPLKEKKSKRARK